MTLQVTARELPNRLEWTDAEGFHSYRQVAGSFVDFARTNIISSEFEAWERFRQQAGMGIHSGTDFPNPYRTKNYWDADSGECLVAGAGFGTGFGNRIVVLSTDNEGVDWLIGVAHLNERPHYEDGRPIERGDPVNRGDLFGSVGSTGTSTGPHNHVWAGKAVDFDAVPDEDTGELLEFSEFWLSPRDDDGRVSRLVDITDFYVDDDKVEPGLPAAFAPPIFERGMSIITLTHDVDTEDLEGVVHHEGAARIWLPGAPGKLEVGVVGAPDFVWEPLRARYPEAIPAGTPALILRK